MAKNVENKAVESKAVVKQETAADFTGLALADFYDRKAKALQDEADKLTDEDKSHQKKVQMYKFRGLAADVRAAVSLSEKLKDKVELSAEESKFLNRVMGIYDRTGGGTSIISEYFKDLDKGSKLPLRLFLYMKNDGEKLPNTMKPEEFMSGIMSGSIKERWNLSQLNKKLTELKLTDTYKVEGEFLVKLA